MQTDDSTPTFSDGRDALRKFGRCSTRVTGQFGILINYHTGHHAFEYVDDNVTTRWVIDQAIDFVKRGTPPQ